MTFQVITFNMSGERTGILGSFGNVASARQAMLDHSNTTELGQPEFHAPALRIVEGWFIGRTEYHIAQVVDHSPLKPANRVVVIPK